MELITHYNRNYRKWFMTDALRAIKTYSMIDKGETICVALSGGKDSVTLLYILYLIKHYSHLSFGLAAIHIKTAEYDTGILEDYCKRLEVPYHEGWLNDHGNAESENACYLCSRLKRGAISSRTKQLKIKKVAYGHHADDIAETIFMNLLQHGKLAGFSPKVEVANSQTVIIRPMIYFSEPAIEKIHGYFRLPLLDYQCPHQHRNIRKGFKEKVRKIGELFDVENFSLILLKSLENKGLLDIRAEKIY